MNGTILSPGRLVCPNDCGSVAPMPPYNAAPVGGGIATMHECAALKGLLVGLVPEGIRAEARAIDREDFVGDEVVQTDSDGRPVMAVVTTRDDGQDCTVYAPLATAKWSDFE